MLNKLIIHDKYDRYLMRSKKTGKSGSTNCPVADKNTTTLHYNSYYMSWCIGLDNFLSKWFHLALCAHILEVIRRDLLVDRSQMDKRSSELNSDGSTLTSCETWLIIIDNIDTYISSGTISRGNFIKTRLYLRDGSHLSILIIVCSYQSAPENNQNR